MTGFPWVVITGTTIYMVEYQLYLTDPRGLFRPDVDMMACISLSVGFWIMLKNIQHISAGDEVGLFTWMKSVNYENDDGSSKKNKF